MKLRRRQFLKTIGAASATILTVPAALWMGQLPDKKRISTPVLKTLSIINDAKIQDLLKCRSMTFHMERPYCRHNGDNENPMGKCGIG